MAYQARRNDEGNAPSKEKNAALAAKLAIDIASENPAAIVQDAIELKKNNGGNLGLPFAPGGIPNNNKILNSLGNQSPNNQVNNANNQIDDSIDTDEQMGSSVSNQEERTESASESFLNSPFKKKNKFNSFFGSDGNDKNSDNEGETDLLGDFKFSFNKKVALTLCIPLIFLLLVILLVISYTSMNFGDFDDAFGISSLTGGPTGNLNYESLSKEAENFYKRVNDVRLDYLKKGKSVDSLKIVAVYHIINQYNNKYDYDYMTTGRIKNIANSMLDGNFYSEEVFRKNLTNKIFLGYFPTYSEKERKRMTDEVFEYIERYLEFVGDGLSGCSNVGSCDYHIKGFANGHNNVSRPMDVSNLKVRLMQCGGKFGGGSFTEPIPNQELVDFEEYVLGVGYGEMGVWPPIEAIKAHMVAARSYSLARPIFMGISTGKKLEQEGNQWILQLSSCVADQIFCNPSKGCSFMGDGIQGGTVMDGNKPGASRGKPPLPEDSPLRTAAAATQGEVLINDQGNIIQASYVSADAQEFIKMAKEGMDYKQILLTHYNSSRRPYDAANIEKMHCNKGGSSCGNISTGPFANWKQYDPAWKNVMMGSSGKNIAQIGCLVTSISILIAKSGVDVTIDNFNPGTFVQLLSRNGKIAANGNYLGGANLAAPSFVQAGNVSLKGQSREYKFNKIKDLLNQGYYIAAEVKGDTGQHWVAIDTIDGSNIKIMDPGSSCTDLWDSDYQWSNTSRLMYFRTV